MSQGTLSGRSILITQGKGKSAKMRRLLEERGACVTEIPLIEIHPLDSPRLEQAIEAIHTFDWIAFTSANGVRIFAQQARRSGSWPPEQGGPQLAVVGPGTAEVLQQTGAQADLVARRHQAEGLLEDLRQRHPEGLQGLRILLPLAAAARPFLAEELKKCGAEAEVVAVYDTLPAHSNRSALNRLLKEDPPDLVTLASSSAARNLVELCDDSGLPDRLNCAAIGPVTADTARQVGLTVALVAETSSSAGMIEAIETYVGSAMLKQTINPAEEQQAESPLPVACRPPAIADGAERPLDPRYVELERVVGGVVTAVIAVCLAIPWLILMIFSSIPLWVLLLVLAGAAALTGFLTWFTQVWPAVDHRHRSYRVDLLGIEIRLGVFWRKVITVPRSRVQHTDVSQGPLERRYGLAKLHIYTAGTQHSKVELPGLTRSTARQIRDHLTVGGEDDAV